jgi:predicted O-methyltransferase YrrM
MLSAQVYAKIYEFAKAAPKGSFVEVGAAHGAATVSLAWALSDRSSDEVVYSFEKIVGGSREKFGSFDENKNILSSNIEAFGMEERVRFAFGDVRNDHAIVPQDETISLMMLDADGRLDRDFALFFDQLVPGSAVIIDDVSPNVRVKCLKKTFEIHNLRIDQKHRITHLLIDLFEKEGLIAGDLCESTYFGVKQSGASYARVAPQVIERYHELVFADARYEAVPGGIAGIVKRALARVLPGSAVEWLRRTYYGKSYRA